METTIQTTTTPEGVVINNKNRRSAREMVTAQGDLNIIKNPRSGKYFFQCGNTKGYVSKKALAAINSGCKLDDLKVADVQIPSMSNDWVPTLMIVGNGDANRIAKFTLAD